MKFSDRIKIYRKYLGLTQETIASRAKINEKYYGRIERGESCPTIEFAVRICDAMEIDIVELFLIEEKNMDEKKFRRSEEIQE